MIQLIEANRPIEYPREVTKPNLTPAAWGQLCRVEAMRATHEPTRMLLLDLATEFEAIAGSSFNFDPDDPDLQSAVAERLSCLAAKRKAWGCG